MNFVACVHRKKNISIQFGEHRLVTQMSDPARLVRKSSYGRTQLFLKDSHVAMREVKCMGGITRKGVANVYHMLPDARDTPGAACWHCCEPVHNVHSVVPLPSAYDPQEGVFHVYGRTCSPACAKAYILEHATFDRGQHLNLLTKMLRDVYGVRHAVVETPPRPALRRFGGVFDPTAQPRAECRLITPPFVSYCMIIEEHMGQPSAVAEETLEEPQPPAAFDEFLTVRASGEGSSSAHASATARISAVHSTPSTRKRPAVAHAGPMSRFVSH